MTPQEMETAIARLFEGQDLLTGKVTELTEDVSELRNAVEAMREMQSEALVEMRTAVGSMLGIAESMAANVRLLTQVQQGTTQRIEAIETRVEKLEQNRDSDQS